MFIINTSIFFYYFKDFLTFSQKQNFSIKGYLKGSLNPTFITHFKEIFIISSKLLYFFINSLHLHKNEMSQPEVTFSHIFLEHYNFFTIIKIFIISLKCIIISQIHFISIKTNFLNPRLIFFKDFCKLIVLFIFR